MNLPIDTDSLKKTLNGMKEDSKLLNVKTLTQEQLMELSNLTLAFGDLLIELSDELNRKEEIILNLVSNLDR